MREPQLPNTPRDPNWNNMFINIASNRLMGFLDTKCLAFITIKSRKKCVDEKKPVCVLSRNHVSLFFVRTLLLLFARVCENLSQRDNARWCEREIYPSCCWPKLEWSRPSSWCASILYFLRLCAFIYIGIDNRYKKIRKNITIYCFAKHISIENPQPHNHTLSVDLCVSAYPNLLYYLPNKSMKGGMREFNCDTYVYSCSQIIHMDGWIYK